MAGKYFLSFVEKVSQTHEIQTAGKKAPKVNDLLRYALHLSDSLQIRSTKLHNDYLNV